LEKRTVLLLIVGIVIAIFAVVFLIQLGSVKPSCIGAKSVNTQYGVITICASLPPTPQNVTLYRVVPQENDMAYFSVDHLVDDRPYTTSESEAPLAVEKALMPYGGLPQGAKLVYVKTEYIETINIDTHQITAKHPVSTNVQYSRNIDDIPVVGGGGSIYIDLGDYGELLYLNKIWRTVEPASTIKIIPASEAIEKMGRGEILGSRPKLIYDMNVDKIRLLYYEKGRGEPQEYLEPVWGFAGTMSNGEPWKYYVPAREGSTLETPAGFSTLRTDLAVVNQS
jgi:hypothetical protein